MKNKALWIILFVIVFFGASMLGVVQAQAESSESDSERLSEQQIDSLECVTGQTHFAKETAFTVSFAPHGDDRIAEYSYKTDGLTVISACINSDGTINLTLSWNEDVAQEVHELMLCAQTVRGTSARQTLYAIQNEYGIFISPICSEYTHLNFCGYALDQGIMTREECDEYMEEVFQCRTRVARAEGADEAQGTRSISAYVSGTLEWTDYDSISHPLRGVYVELYEDVSPVSLLATTHTNDSGVFSFSFAADLLNNYFIKVYAGADAQNNIVRTASAGSYYMGYYQRFDLDIDSNTGTATCNHVFPKNNNRGHAFQISQAMITARDYATVMMNAVPDNIHVIYPSNSWNYSHKDNVNVLTSQIHIPDGGNNTNVLDTYSSWDRIMHEYGHHVAYDLGMVGDEDFAPQCSFDIMGTEASTNGKAYGIRNAWYEGWSTIFGALAQRYYASLLTNIPTVADALFDEYNRSTFSYETPTVANGETSVSSIMAVLWDLFDGTGLDTDNDGIALSHANWWSVTTNNTVTTFSEFSAQFESVYPQLLMYYRGILTDYNIAPALDTTVLTDFFHLPSFSWSNPGGTGSYLNNEFELHIISALGGIVVTKNGLTGSYTTTSPYVLSSTDANTLAEEYPGSFSWYVVAYQNDTAGSGPQTGPYTSSIQTVYFPSITTLTVNNDITGSITSSLPQEWYKVTTSSSSITYIFSTSYTASNLDTYGELFNENPVFGTSTSGRFTWDDNSGTGNNFSISITIPAYQTYYIRVTANNSQTGTYVISLDTSNHTHSYTSYSVPYNLGYHQSYCSCGAFVLNPHYWVQIGTRLWECMDCGQRTVKPPLYLTSHGGDEPFDWEFLSPDDWTEDALLPDDALLPEDAYLSESKYSF